MAPAGNTPQNLRDPALPVPDHIKGHHVGTWITNFDVQFPDTAGGFIPTSILCCYRFDLDGTFKAHQLRNKGGALDEKPRTGTYTTQWNESLGVVSGKIAINSQGNISLFFYMRNLNELHWIMQSTDVLTPVAQGIMYKVDYPGA